MKLFHIDWLPLATPSAGASGEDAGDVRAAVTTAVAVERVLAEFVPVPFDEPLLTVRTERALPSGVIDVADVDVFQSGLQRDVARGDQCFVRRARAVEHSEVGMKR